MATIERLDEVRGKTIRFTWKDGPTKGKTHEHVFHDDGTVEWHSMGSSDGGSSGQAERVRYADEKITRVVRLVSYLSKSGYTLTVALNFEDRSIVGIASNEKTWTSVHGSFEVMTSQ